MKPLNIGCGRDYRPGYINTDISRDTKADLYFDIRKDQFPWEDNSAPSIYISGVLEQIGSNDEFLHAMNELHRVLKPGGVMTVVVPNARFAIAHRDPMDIRKFTAETFSYFRNKAQEHALYGAVYGFPAWSEIRIEENERHIFTVFMTK